MTKTSNTAKKPKKTPNYSYFFLPEDTGGMIPKLSSDQGKHRISYFQTSLSRYLDKLLLTTLNSVSMANKNILVQYFILCCSPRCFHSSVQSFNDGL